MPSHGKEVYVAPDIFETPEGEYDPQKGKKTKTQRADIVDAIKKQQFILLEGSMGAGKSKLLRRLVREYAQPESFAENCLIPIYLSYSDFKEKHHGQLNSVVDSCVPEDVRVLLPDATRYLLLVDGLDEVDQPITAQASQLNSLAKDIATRNDIVVIVSSRFLDGLTEEQALYKGIYRSMALR